MGPEWDGVRPRFIWDDKGLLTGVDFPGAPPPVPAATSPEPPGTGSRYRGMYDLGERLRDYEKLGIERQFLFATDYPHADPGGRMKFRDVELLERRTDIGAGDKESIWNGNALRLPGGA
jgi:predicted TIM-barrel fold metal-dependent hydrolase